MSFLPENDLKRSFVFGIREVAVEASYRDVDVAILNSTNLRPKTSSRLHLACPHSNKIPVGNGYFPSLSNLLSYDLPERREKRRKNKTRLPKVAHFISLSCQEPVILISIQTSTGMKIVCMKLNVFTRES